MMHGMLRRSVLVAIPLLPLAVWACSRGGDLKTLTVDEVATRLAANDGKTFVYDDNHHERYLKGHVPGAKWLSTPEPTAADLPADKTATLIFYCASEL